MHFYGIEQTLFWLAYELSDTASMVPDSLCVQNMKCIPNNTYAHTPMHIHCHSGYLQIFDFLLLICWFADLPQVWGQFQASHTTPALPLHQSLN